MPWLMANHKFASQIIATHPMEPANIFDDQALVLLRTYVYDTNKRKEILEQRDLWDEDQSVMELKCNKAGNLVCLAISKEVLNEEEVGMLKEWFESEEMVKELEGVSARGKKEMGQA
jgi:hypothetical protein